jgi:hypothetical protein
VKREVKIMSKDQVFAGKLFVPRLIVVPFADFAVKVGPAIDAAAFFMKHDVFNPFAHIVYCSGLTGLQLGALFNVRAAHFGLSDIERQDSHMCVFKQDTGFRQLYGMGLPRRIYRLLVRALLTFQMLGIRVANVRLEVVALLMLVTMLSGRNDTNALDTLVLIDALIAAYEAATGIAPEEQHEHVQMFVGGDDNAMASDVPIDMTAFDAAMIEMALPTTSWSTTELSEVEFYSAVFIPIQPVVVRVAGRDIVASHILSQKPGRALVKFGCAVKGVQFVGNRELELRYLRGRALSMYWNTGSHIVRAMLDSVLRLSHGLKAIVSKDEHWSRPDNAVEFELTEEPDFECQRYACSRVLMHEILCTLNSLEDHNVIFEDSGIFDIDF